MPLRVRSDAHHVQGHAHLLQLAADPNHQNHQNDGNGIRQTQPSFITKRRHRNVEALPHDASTNVVGIRDDSASATGRTPRGIHPLVGYGNETWV